MADTDAALPLFPLGSVLFPAMLMPLHVFEPRYRLLLRRTLRTEQPFGIVLIRSGTEVGGPAEPHRVGTTAKVVGATPLADGRSFIVCKGERRFEIDAVDADREPYLLARVRYLEEDDGLEAEHLADEAAEAFGDYLGGILATTPDPRADLTTADELRAGTPKDVSYRIAAGLGIEAAERQRLLETDRTATRLETELGLLARENTLLKELLLRIRVSGSGPTLN